MGNAFSKLKRRFRRNSGQQITDARTGNSISRDGLLHEVTEKSLLVDASKLTSKRRSRHPDHHRYWESPFVNEAYGQPAVLSICINRDLGIGEITSLCHRFRFEDEEETYESQGTEEQVGTTENRSNEERSHKDRKGRHKRRSRRRRAEQNIGNSDEVKVDKSAVENDKLVKKSGSEGNEDKCTPTERDNVTGYNKTANQDQMTDECEKEQAYKNRHEGKTEHEQSEMNNPDVNKLTQRSEREEMEESNICKAALSDDNSAEKESSRETTACGEEKLGQAAEINVQSQRLENMVAKETLMADDSDEGDFMSMQIGQYPTADTGSSSGTNSSSLTDYSSLTPNTFDSFDSNDDICTSSSPTAYDSFESDEDEIKQFPAFVTPFLNKDVRIRLQFHRAIHSTFNSTFKKCEPVHLWRHVKYIDARFLGQPAQKRMEIMLEESHGSRRQPFGTSRRSRPLFPRAIIVNTCEETPGLYVAGKEFSILLAPPTGGAQELDDGRILYAIGTYVRYLDTDQNYLMLWRASVVEDSVIE
ncbi:uncharacterized protein LOC135466941 [Liolophura sinensis]|uniref:uncharacterized protein LOC135466941 n=1 Tax=Liolophura sinensis TaxID=3198878 RepID=UPI003158A52D